MKRGFDKLFLQDLIVIYKNVTFRSRKKHFFVSFPLPFPEEGSLIIDWSCSTVFLNKGSFTCHSYSFGGWAWKLSWRDQLDCFKALLGLWWSLIRNSSKLKVRLDMRLIRSMIAARLSWWCLTHQHRWTSEVVSCEARFGAKIKK